MNSEEKQGGNHRRGRNEEADRVINEEETQAPTKVEVDDNLLALEKLRSLLDKAPNHDKAALEKEIRGVKADYLRGDENAVRDYLYYHRIPSENLGTDDPNMHLYQELRVDPKINGDALSIALKDYQDGDNQAIVQLAHRSGHESAVSDAARSGNAPYRDVDLALTKFQSQRESLEKKMAKTGSEMSALEGRRHNLDTSIANLQKERARGEISRTAEENARKPSEEKKTAFQTKVSEGRKAGLSEGETVEAKKSGEANAMKAPEIDLNQPKERLALEIKAELEKSQSQGETTDRLRDIMRKIPLGRLHADVEKNSTHSITLSKEVANALEKHQRKERQKNSRGTGIRVSFS